MSETVPVELVPWERVHELARTLAHQVREDGYDPDVIVAIGRGGYAPGRLMADFLHKKELVSFRLAHYEAGPERGEEIRLEEALSAEVDGRRVLVVDDVNDSGETIEAARSHLEQKGAAEVKSAVLLEKSTTTLGADYVAGRVEDWHWITFPWAVIEDLTTFIRAMEPRPETVAEAARRLAADHGIQVSDQTIEDVFQCWPRR